MTVGVAWIRERPNGDELWLASDSRLSGDGYLWDSSPKLFLVPRRDAVAAFSGETAQAYPLLLQIGNAMLGYEPAASGGLEFARLAKHLQRVVNLMMDQLEVDPRVSGSAVAAPFRTLGDVVVLGGYSRAARGFVLRRLHFEQNVGRWVFGRAEGRPSVVGTSKPYKVYGDRQASPKLDYLLLDRLASVGKLGNDEPFAMEPLEAIWDYLSKPAASQRPVPDGQRPPTIGGAPQVVVVRSGAAATPVAVRWQDKDFVLGRQVLPYENLTVPLIVRGEDPPRFQLIAPGAWQPLRADAGGAEPLELDDLIEP